MKKGGYSGAGGNARTFTEGQKYDHPGKSPLFSHWGCYLNAGGLPAGHAGRSQQERALRLPGPAPDLHLFCTDLVPSGTFKLPLHQSPPKNKYFSPLLGFQEGPRRGIK